MKFRNLILCFPLIPRVTPRAWGHLLIPLMTMGLYVGSAMIERLVAYPHPTRGTVWWAAGWATAMTYLFGRRALAGVFLGEWIMSVPVFGFPVWFGFLTATGNTLEAALGAWILRRLSYVAPMNRSRDVRSLFIAAVAAPIPILVFQSTAMSLHGRFQGVSAFRDVVQWFSNDALAILYIVPAVGLIPLFQDRSQLRRSRIGECAGLLVGLVSVTVIAYGTPAGYLFAGLSVAAIPFLAWAAFRFDPTTTSLALLCYACSIVFCIARRIDPFRTEDLQVFPYLHVLLGIVAILAHLMAAVVAEREEAIRRYRQNAQWEGLGILAGGLAHEFNNRLTVVVGSIELARNQIPRESPIRELLDSAQDATARMNHLTASLLTYSGRSVRKNLQPNDLVTVVADVISEVKSPVAYDARGAQGCLLFADSLLLRTIVRNVLANAIESTGPVQTEVRVTVDVRFVRTLELANAWPQPGTKGRYVSIRVEDRGCGMTAEVMSRMFDPFFSTKFPGRGLGLAAVGGAVRQMSGCILVESQVGIGTSMELLFPYDRDLNRTRQDLPDPESSTSSISSL